MIVRCGRPLWALGRRVYSSSAETQKTCLNAFHMRHGGKMVDFAGWDMPVQYSDLSLRDSVLHTRKGASLFDVSHMLQTKVHGKDRIPFMESLVTGDLAELGTGSGALTLFTNAAGGIEDDLIVTSADDHLYVVSNAGCAHKDLPYMQAAAEAYRGFGGDVMLEVLAERGLLAVQGPAMRDILGGSAVEGLDLSRLGFMQSAEATVLGVVGCRVTRCGYTGEDGVEISVPQEEAENLAEALLEAGKDSLRLAGLGARDALRLEAGLCLYGNDIDETTTPVEATLAWLLGKRRRVDGGFPGDKVILAQLRDKTATKKRVGVVCESGRPPRRGAKLRLESGEAVGEVTSGVPSPCLGFSVAMAYVRTDAAKLGTPLLVDHSGKDTKKQIANVSKMPFIKSNYYVIGK